MSAHALIFAVTFIALLVGHYVGDFWLQTASQAKNKALKNWRGRSACFRHAAVLTVTKAIILAITIFATDLRVSLPTVICALVIDGVSHYWADRRTTLKSLAGILGKSDFYALGTPRPNKDDNHVLGTGAHALDQAWHIAWIWIAALIVAAA